MFKKKSCKNCGKKVSGSDSFCSACGARIAENENEWGLLGREDERVEDEFEKLSKILFGGTNSKIFNKMLGGAFKMLEKEMQKMEKMPPAKTSFQLYINGKKVDPENISMGQKKVVMPLKKETVQKKTISREKIKKMTTLPRKEPSTNMRRISDNVFYELDVPGVESIEDVLITRLESSIEVKALAKDKVYSKLIPINLPVKKYELLKDKLILHLDTQ